MFKIGVIPGDGVGPEVIRHAVAVLEFLNRDESLGLEFQSFDLGAESYRRTGEALPETELAGLKGVDAILLGAVGDPSVPPGILEKGLLLRIRFDFHQYINLRPVRLYPGAETPIKGKGPNEINFAVVRENNEDLYVGAGGFLRKGTKEETAIQTSINTRLGVDRCLRYAFELARKRAGERTFPGLSPAEVDQGKRGRVTLVAKTNVLTFAHDLWMRAFEAMQPVYPEIHSDYQHVDACAMRMIVAPERFDVIATTNMFGDIITDIGAVLQGGMGLAASANLNPEGALPSMFEPVHGSAPDIAGKGVANPLAAILSAAMLLDHLGKPGSGERIRSAVATVLAAGTPKTPDLGGRGSTEEVAGAVLKAIGAA